MPLPVAKVPSIAAPAALAAPASWALAMALAITALVAASPLHAADTVQNPPPQAKDWTDLAKLPDWRGV